MFRLASGLRSCKELSLSLVGSRSLGIIGSLKDYQEDAVSDLKAGGFISSNPQGYKTPQDCAGVSAKSSSNFTTMVSERSLVFHTRRWFGTVGQAAPTIRQIKCHDDFELFSEEVRSLESNLDADSIIKPYENELITDKDILKGCCKSRLGPIGFQLLRQLGPLITLNLKRGINISELIKLQNILWSQAHDAIILKETKMSGNEETMCPYKALHRLFHLVVELSTGMKLDEIGAPPNVADYLNIISEGSWFNRKRITNHTATRSPGERIQRYIRACYLLRKEYNFIGGTKKNKGSYILRMVGEVIPKELFQEEGLHPIVDYWERYSENMRGGASSSSSPLQWPLSDTGDELTVYATKRRLGMLLVALFRDALEHPFGPWHAKNDPDEPRYSLLDVVDLLDAICPEYGLTLDKSILATNLSSDFDMDQSRPSYLDWTDSAPT